ncbi:hypothetical protein NH340_JMT05135 [Sarcoptes scabiei]|nr:hypothetical protein NH340_JMT05135 [Sarcoptes scabiei]
MRQKSDNSEPILESSKHQYHHSSLSSLQNFNQQSPPHSQQYRSAVLASTKSSLNDNGQNKNEHPSSSSSALFDGSKKKSRYILFSQLYLIVHISLAICLSQTKGLLVFIHIIYSLILHQRFVRAYRIKSIQNPYSSSWTFSFSIFLLER